MSGKSKSDYKSVFKALTDQTPAEPRVCSITADFEAAVWRAIRQVLPQVNIHECVFHFTQAVWRKIQQLGLQVAYNKKSSTYNFCRYLMALPFLPSEYIPAQFQLLRSTETSTTISQLLDCYHDQWMHNETFPISSWSVYGRPIRTNNDIEGWHKRFNNMANHQHKLNLYQLISILHTEANNIKLQTMMISNGTVLRHYRSKYKKTQAIIMNAWEQLRDGNFSAKKVLKICSRVNGPTVQCL